MHLHAPLSASKTSFSLRHPLPHLHLPPLFPSYTFFAFSSSLYLLLSLLWMLFLRSKHVYVLKLVIRFSYKALYKHFIEKFERIFQCLDLCYNNILNILSSFQLWIKILQMPLSYGTVAFYLLLSHYFIYRVTQKEWDFRDVFTNCTSSFFSPCNFILYTFFAKSFNTFISPKNK